MMKLKRVCLVRGCHWPITNKTLDNIKKWKVNQFCEMSFKCGYEDGARICPER